VCDWSTCKCIHVTEYAPVKTGNILKVMCTFPNFQNCACWEKYLKDNNTITSIWHEHKLWYLSLSKLTVSLESRSRKTIFFSEQILSVDKYSSIFLCQMEAIVYMLYLLVYNCFFCCHFRPRESRGGPTVLILSPTRELALQIEAEVKKFHYRGIRRLVEFS